MPNGLEINMIRFLENNVSIFVLNCHFDVIHLQVVDHNVGRAID